MKHKEEQFIEQKFGKEAGFKVPDGYFDTLTENILAQLPENNAKIVKMKSSRAAWLRPISIAAASICIALFGAGIYFNHTDKQPQQIVAQTQTTSSYSTLDQAVDYAMLDNEDMYAYCMGE